MPHRNPKAASTNLFRKFILYFYFFDCIILIFKLKCATSLKHLINIVNLLILHNIQLKINPNIYNTSIIQIIFFAPVRRKQPKLKKILKHGKEDNEINDT